jgi:murein L,D-transpeptidase YcbB/YkuD
MVRGYLRVLLTAAAVTFAGMPVRGQTVVPQPAAVAIAPAPAIDPAITTYYALRPGAQIWFRDADTRTAAMKLAALFKRAASDSLSDGAALAAQVESAIARGQPADEQIISDAWVKFVRGLQRPVEGVSYGDAALEMKPQTAEKILIAASRAPSLSQFVDQTAAVNPFYSALRDDAEKNGTLDDPRVRATLDRLRLIPGKGRAIVVDVANAQLMMLEDGQVVDTMKTVVGKKDAATPLLAGTIHYVTFNPYWHIPQDVARRKVAPIVLKRGISYLKAARYETVAAFGGDKEAPIDPASVDWKAVASGQVEVHIRQLNGPNNMMGKMKFGFVNDYGIFLHDTPHKDFFAKAKRNLSLGCVRLEHPDRLAQWLLGREPTPPGDGSEQLVQLDKGVPIYITYLTARPGEDGAIAYADDVYGLDTPGAGKAILATAATAQ